MGKTLVILQSNYLPWKGYFSQILASDYFVFLDDVQYSPRNWRNRNLIKTRNGLKWLSVPCFHHNKINIDEVEILSNGWQEKHWKSIYHAYHKTPYFDNYKNFFENVYLNMNWDNLSNLNQYLITNISGKILNIKTRFLNSKEFSTQSNGLSKILDIVDKIGDVETYFTGPSAYNYIKGNENQFKERKINLEYMNYSGYKEYPQLFGQFIHEVSIIDLLFNTGPNARDYLINNFINKRLH